MDIEHPLNMRPRASWLDLPLARVVTLNRATLLLAFFVVVAIGTRFWDVGARALHHDESLHAFYSWNLYDHGVYRHEPLMHGPLLFHLTALGYWLLGDSDFTARVVPALLGVLLVWAPWKFRAYLGTRGALVASAMILISPTILYYSRFLREDIFAAAWTVLIVYGLWKYMERGQPFHLYVMSAGWALLFSQKEISFLMAAVFWGFLALVLGLRLAGRLGPKVALRDAREWHLMVFLGALLLPFVTAVIMHLPAMLNGRFALELPIWDPGAVGGNSETSVYNDPAAWPFLFNLRAYTTAVLLTGLGALAAARLWSWRRFLIGAGVFWAIFLLLHTTFLTNLYGVGSGVIGALGYWLEQHGVERGEQPWYYYTMLLPLYEFLPLLVGLGGSVLLLATRRNEPIAPAVPGEAPHLSARALWPWFNLWWFLGSFVLLSYAGEKMPWLLTHLALPLCFLAGWALGRVLDGVAWSHLHARGGMWFALLFAVLLLGGISVLWLLATGQLPFQGNDTLSLQRTARWVVTLLMLMGVGWVAAGVLRRLGQRSAAQVALLTVVALLAVATIRFAVIASFINGDIANEPLIYVQSSPMVTEVMADLDAISERIEGGRNLKIAYDNHSSWPFSWYLRDYPNAFFFGASPQEYADSVRGASVVLVGNENELALKPLVNGYVRHEYKMRWWFPEDYRDVKEVTEPDPATPGQRITTGETSNSPLVILRNLMWYAQQPQYLQDFVTFFLHREIKDPLSGEEFIVYLKPEIAAEVWQHGSPVTSMAGVLPGLDPYLEAAVALPASQIVASGTLSSPHDVAVLPDGALAVADSGAHRIRIVQPDGTLLSEFGTFGAEPGQFNEPWGIAAAPDGTLYVADTWNHRVQHLDTEGRVLHVWGTFGETQGQLGEPGLFWGPRGIAVDEAGDVYVADTGNRRVQVFDAEGTFLRQFGGGGAELGLLAEPVGIAVAPDGSVWVADTWNRRVQQFDAQGQPLRQIPIQSWVGENVTNKPYLAASADRLWVSDPESARLIEMDHTGTLLRVWGQFGADDSSLNLPFGLRWQDGTLWVADSGNQRVLGFDLDEGEAP